MGVCVGGVRAPLKPLSIKVEGELDRAVKEIELMGEEIDAQEKGIARDIGASFEELHAILERHKNLLLK